MEVSIGGCYQTKYRGLDKERSLTDLVFECSKGLLDKYGLKRDEVDQVIIAADDLLDGRSISSMVTAAPAGGLLKEFMKVAGDGAFAFAYGCLGIEAGLSDLTMVVGWSKVLEVPFHCVTNLTFEPFYLRPFFDETTSKAVQAQKYVAQFNITPDQAALVSVKNRSNACKNSNAHLRSEVGVEEVLSSELVSSPIRSLTNSVLSEGACAVLVASEKRSRAFKKPVRIRGIGWDTDSYHMGDRDLSELTSLEKASTTAYEMAGIEYPVDEIDVAEISDISAFHELMEYEALGFCDRGAGGKFMEDGHTRLGGKLPVNPSGGLISSNPGCAAGLSRIAEAYLQVSGDAGEHQIDHVNTSLAHGIQGNACQANCVVLLSK